ncbi:putative epidermal cell surface receptor isoform X3 [Cryptotermes secundus]|nr:putative epidermal cell surface receptor isoform X3 [Cryptotermes secundus]
MLVVWLLLTLNLVLVHSSEVQRPLTICDKDAASVGNCTSESVGNATASSSQTLTPSTTSNPLTTEIASNNTSTSARPLLFNASEPSDGGGQTHLKPQTDEETSRNSSSGAAHGRAMNLDVHEHQSAGSQAAVSAENSSLQDLSLDDIDETAILPTQIHDDEMNITVFNITMPPPLLQNSSSTSVTSTEHPTSTTVASNSSDFTMVNGSSCIQGQKFDRGCSESCECGFDGKAICRPRCSMPFFRRGARINDPACIEKLAEDPCCSLLVCTQDTETEPLEGCTFKNQSYQRGNTFNDGCLAVCTCAEAGQVVCKPRCPAVHNVSSTDRCVELPDPIDPCCTVVLCDVTLGDHDVSKAGIEDAAGSPHLQLLTVEIVNRTTVRLGLAGDLQSRHDNVTVESSLDQKTWKRQDAKGLLVQGLEPGRSYYLRVKGGNVVSNAVEVTLPTNGTQRPVTAGCQHKGRHYMFGEEFHDGCEAYCVCTDSGVQCATIECPTEFGLDVLDPSCLDWETHPPGFKPSPPNCCPEQVRCINNGSCVYEGQYFSNWAEIPTKLTGCTQKCYCEYGNVSCQSTCPPVTASPPSDLQCDPHQAILSHLPGEDCCLYWLCPQLQHSGFLEHPLPPVIPLQGHISRSQDEITVHMLEAVDEHTVKLIFSVPPVLVGLHGRVQLRYTSDKQNSDPSSWNQQELAPPGDLIATPQLEFELGDLTPDTEYKMKITVILRDLHNSPTSKILSVHTPPAATPTTTLPPQIPVDAALAVVGLNATWARLMWRKFSEFELQFIDGVQLRYKEKDGKVYAATPLIHRAVTSYTLEDLRPHTDYEVGIFFIPFPGQSTELTAERTTEFTTADVHDLYKFNVTLDVQHIKSTSVELSWSGVPYPEDKYVNIFRAIYQSDAGKEDFSTFKVAKRDSQARTIIQDLKPGTRYRLWLEVYLTNGKIKKSNVQDFMTKPGAVSSVGATQQGKLKGVDPEPLVETADYYGPLVAVAIIAALAIVATLILLLILMRKHGHNKAAISTTRKSQSAYDNPSYKVEIQQETMDL